MGNRKVSILEPAAEAVADVALFIESRGLPKTAKKFVDEVFRFFEKLSDEMKYTYNYSTPNIAGKGKTVKLLVSNGKEVMEIRIEN